MWLRRCLWAAAAALGAGPAAADRAARPPGPDPAGLIRGDWVVAAVEHEGIVTPQFEPPGERRLDHLWRMLHHPSDRDKIADPRPLPPAIPPDTLVYRFGDGRFTVWQDLRRVGWGRYRFDPAARPPALEVTWEKMPESFPREDRYRSACRIGDGTMDWCHDAANPLRPPGRFAGDRGKLYLVTFRRLS